MHARVRAHTRMPSTHTASHWGRSLLQTEASSFWNSSKLTLQYGCHARPQDSGAKKGTSAFTWEGKRIFFFFPHKRLLRKSRAESTSTVREENKKTNEADACHTLIEFQDSYNLLQFAHNLKMSTTARQKITKLNTIRIYSPWEKNKTRDQPTMIVKAKMTKSGKRKHFLKKQQKDLNLNRE